MIDFGVIIPNYIECIPNTMYVEKIEYGERKTKGGLYIQAEQMDYEGRFAHPRWAKVRYKADNIKQKLPAERLAVDSSCDQSVT